MYNTVIFLWALFLLPRVIYQRIRYKKYKGSLLERLGLQKRKIPEKKAGEFRIWIHAASLGETKAVGPLVEEIRKSFPEATLVFSSITETGYKEAAKYKPHIAFFLPLDLSFIIRKYVDQVRPDLFVLVESDYWCNLLKYVHNKGAKVALINGKLSPTSYKRFLWIKQFSKQLFSYIDLFCLQGEEHEARFLAFDVPKDRLHITGNVKFDLQTPGREYTGIHLPKGSNIVTLASTHEGEEAMLLEILLRMNLTAIVAPRHSERFKEVSSWLEKRGVPFRKISEEDKGERVVLVDRMGVLDPCYSVSFATIMGGSFISHVGGHNIYEPTRLGSPVIYGPHMHKQEGLVKALQKYKVGNQISLEELEATLSVYLQRGCDKEALLQLKEAMEGATKRSWGHIQKTLDEVF